MQQNAEFFADPQRIRLQTPQARRVVALFKTIYDEDLTTKNQDYAAATNGFINGEGGVYLVGTWLIGDFDAESSKPDRPLSNGYTVVPLSAALSRARRHVRRRARVGDAGEEATRAATRGRIRLMKFMADHDLEWSRTGHLPAFDGHRQRTLQGAAVPRQYRETRDHRHAAAGESAASVRDPGNHRRRNGAGDRWPKSDRCRARRRRASRQRSAVSLALKASCGERLSARSDHVPQHRNLHMLRSYLVDRDLVISALDRRVFGTFVEHMGRCVYGGIYEPRRIRPRTSNGFRQDVLELTRELGPTIVRYPGGNFLSGYNWEDGVGPKDKRPTRLDLAWGSTETNQFGTNEFIDWCRTANVEPMFAVNLGTRGPDEARNLLEYCNHPGGTYYSDLRRSHGYEKPHDIKFWCLGNEMDGPWQICRKTAHGVRSHRAGDRQGHALGRRQICSLPPADPRSARCRRMARGNTRCWITASTKSISSRCTRTSATTATTSANTSRSSRTWIPSSGKSPRSAMPWPRSAARRKRIMLSLDEWNVWYKAHTPADLRKPGWPQAPPLIEEIYNFEDALIVGGALITMINNADRVKAACIAQLVNVIGPIMTETGGAAWRQTIFHPFAQASRYARGERAARARSRRRRIRPRRIARRAVRSGQRRARSGQRRGDHPGAQSAHDAKRSNSKWSCAAWVQPQGRRWRASCITATSRRSTASQRQMRCAAEAQRRDNLAATAAREAEAAVVECHRDNAGLNVDERRSADSMRRS